jgi:hypothetical protein
MKEHYCIGEGCWECKKAQQDNTVSKSASVGVMPRFIEKMHIDFERYISSNLNWPIERAGSTYFDKRTDGAWKVYKFAKVA